MNIAGFYPVPGRLLFSGDNEPVTLDQIQKNTFFKIGANIYQVLAPPRCVPEEEIPYMRKRGQENLPSGMNMPEGIEVDVLIYQNGRTPKPKANFRIAFPGGNPA